MGIFDFVIFDRMCHALFCGGFCHAERARQDGPELELMRTKGAFPFLDSTEARTSTVYSTCILTTTLYMWVQVKV